MIISIKLIVTVSNINTKNMGYTVSVLINLRFFLH